MTDKTGRRHAAAAQPSRVCRGFLRDGSRGDGIISETTATDVSRSPRMSVALLMAAILALSAMPSRAGTPTIREYSLTSAAMSTSPVSSEAYAVEHKPTEGFSPIGICLLPGIAFPDEHWDVCPLRINLIAGRNLDVYGFDFGLVGNIVEEEFLGFQVAGFFNRIGHSAGAIQLSVIVNRCYGDFAGLESAIANIVDGELDGLQVGFYNRVPVLNGVQFGIVNIVDSGCGVQIGLVNSARELDGLQIGVVNVIRDSTMPFLPVINFAF